MSACARCLAGRCGHEACRANDWGLGTRTQVAGTDCCRDCAGAMLDLIENPLVHLTQPHVHDWAPIALDPASPTAKGDPRTNVVSRCKVCGDIKQKVIRGTWTMPDLMGW